MRIAALATLALTLSARAAAAAPIDDWLAARAEGADAVVVPQVAQVGDALSGGALRLLSHPALAHLTVEARTTLDVKLGFDPFDLAAHQARGLDPRGPAYFTEGALVLPVGGASEGEDYLSAVLGSQLTDAQILGRRGWRTDAGVALYAGGLMFAARDEQTLRALVDAPTAPAADLTGCPHGRGQADLYLLRARAPLGGGCVTAIFDPGRTVIEARFAQGGKALGPADEAIWARLGAGATAAVALRLDPGRADRARAKLTRMLPGLAEQLDGRIGASAGPAATDLTLVMGVADGEKAKAALSSLLQGVPRDTATLSPDGVGFRVRVKLPEGWPAGLPRLDVAWIGVRDGFLVATTRADGGAPDGDPRRSRPGGADLTSLRGASLGVLWQVGGAPHDGSVWFDALSALVEAGLDADTLREMTAAAAFAAAHLGAVSFGVHREKGGLRMRLEMVTL